MSNFKKYYFIKLHSINENLRNVLNTESIYATPLHILNDPIERIELLTIRKSSSSKYSTDYRNKFGIFCVSKFSKKHFSSHLLPMWAYYGDDHSAVGLVMEPIGVIGEHWHAMSYVDDHFDRNFDGRDKDDYKIAEKSLSCKLKPWSHEHEYRLIFRPEDAGQMHEWNQFFILKQIVFGYKCKPEKINEVISWLSDNLLSRLIKNIDDPDFLDILQVREPWSPISDMAPMRIVFENRESLVMTGHRCTYEQNSNDFYPIGSLYAGQIPVMRMPDFSKLKDK